MTADPYQELPRTTRRRSLPPIHPTLACSRPGTCLRLALRARQSRDARHLLLSFGIPRLLGGDEMGRTQQGNNNGEMTGADWSDANALAVALYLDGSDDPDQAADGTWLVDDDFLVRWQHEIDTYDPRRRLGRWRTARSATASGSAPARWSSWPSAPGPRK
jgi:hypothetical protein